MNKEEIVSALADLLRGRVKELEASLKDTRERAIDAPSSSESHSDTSKSQLSHLAAGLQQQLQKAQEDLNYVVTTPIHYNKGTVSVGSLIELKDKGTSGGIRICFIVLRAGGENIQVNNSVVTTLTPSAPLARACMGRKKGEEVSCNNRSYLIENVS